MCPLIVSRGVQRFPRPQMTGKRGVPLLEVLVVVTVLIALCVFAGRQYKVA